MEMRIESETSHKCNKNINNLICSDSIAVKANPNRGKARGEKRIKGMFMWA